MTKKRKYLTSLRLSLVFLLITFINTRVSAQVPTSNPPQRSPLPVIPRPQSPNPTLTPAEIPPQENILPPIDNDNNLVIPKGNIKVKEFKFQGNTVFSTEELASLTITIADSENPLPISEIKNRNLSFLELNQIATKVAEFYHQKGYKTSGAIISLGENLPSPDEEVPVTIEVKEGILQAIQVRLFEQKQEDSTVKDFLQGRLANYVQSRLKVELNKPLNVDNLLEALQLLKIDPLIQQISATLSSSSTENQSILIVEYTPTNLLATDINMDNSGSPSVGTFKPSVTLKGNNLLGLGDVVRSSYYYTEGSNEFDLNYTVPVNRYNGTITFSYNWNDNGIIEPPFADLDNDGKSPDITSNSTTYELTFRQPIIQQISEQSYQNLAVGLTSSWRENQSFLFDTPFPLSPGADNNGITRIFALRFFQEYSLQDSQQVFALRSQFNLGIDGFNSTINRESYDGESIPDSNFFYWQGQVQYAYLFSQNNLFLVRGNIQLASQPLVPMEQFATGGINSVRGYRQDLLLTDNGLFLSAEYQLPILSIPEWNSVVQLIPFVDYGKGWNTDRVNPNPSNLWSLGLGLQWRVNDNFQARLDYAFPMVTINSSKNTLQEQGLYFTIRYHPF